MACISETDTA